MQKKIVGRVKKNGKFRNKSVLGNRSENLYNRSLYIYGQNNIFLEPQIRLEICAYITFTQNLQRKCQ